MSGLSSRNLLAMKVFAREFPDGPIAQQAVAQLPWGHLLQIMQRLKTPAARDFYIRETLTHGWSRSILQTQIQSQLHLRTGDVGQINLYRSAVDDLLRHPDDQSTIGLLLCKGKNRLVAEYALHGLEHSLAVADWQAQLTHSLPDELRSSLPSIEEIEAELAQDFVSVKPRKGGKV
jgi:hypothetical protein